MSLTKRDKKQRNAFIAGIAAVLVGGWMLLVAKDVRGLIPGAIGTLLIIWRFR